MGNQHSANERTNPDVEKLVVRYVCAGLEFLEEGLGTRKYVSFDEQQRGFLTSQIRVEDKSDSIGKVVFEWHDMHQKRSVSRCKVFTIGQDDFVSGVRVCYLRGDNSEERGIRRLQFCLDSGKSSEIYGANQLPRFAKSKWYSLTKEGYYINGVYGTTFQDGWTTQPSLTTLGVYFMPKRQVGVAR